jgi:hypothetical protein
MDCIRERAHQVNFHDSPQSINPIHPTLTAPNDPP